MTENLGPGEGQSTVRPCAQDPKQRDRTDRDEGASGVDQRRRPIRHTELEVMTAENGLAWDR